MRPEWEEHVKKIVAAWPPLTEDQKHKIRLIFLTHYKEQDAKDRV